MFYNVSNDITEFSGDAIVNSLGIGRYIDRPGAIYRSILRKCENSRMVRAIVCEKGADLPFGAMFDTPSFGLPCKAIIHVITPFRSNDPDLFAIKQCYEDILAFALKRGFASINVPLIGCGANGYESDEVAFAAQKICRAFANKHPEFDIYFNTSFVSKRYPEPVRPGAVPERRPMGVPKAFPKGEPGTLETPKPKTMMERIGMKFEDSFPTFLKKYVYHQVRGSKEQQEAALDEVWDDIDALVGDYKTDKDVLGDTVEEIQSKENIKAPEGTYKKKSKETHAPSYDWKLKPAGKGKGYVWQKPNKADLLLVGIALHLSKDELMELYEFCGYALSPYDRQDYAFRECVKQIGSKNPWSMVLKTYRGCMSEEFYDYHQDRQKIYTDEKQ